MLGLRKDAMHSSIEKADSAKKMATAIFGKELNENTVDAINHRIDEIGGRLEAWLVSLPQEKQNAFYKTA